MKNLSRVLFGLFLLGNAAAALATTTDDGAIPRPKCFNGDICLQRIADCIDPAGHYPSFTYTLKTTVNCVTYDGKVVTTYSVAPGQQSVDTGANDAEQVANCQLLHNQLQQTYPACQ